MARFDRTILPGGEGAIHLKLKTKGYNGAVNKRATVFSDDPKNPKSYLFLKAKIKPIISVKPRSVHLVGLAGEPITGVATITAHEALPLTLTPLEFSLPEKVAYEIKAVEDGRVFRITFRNKADQIGRYVGILQLKTSYTEKPLLKIRVHGNIKGSLQVTPETVHLGRLNIASLRDSQTKELIRSLEIKAIGDKSFKIEKINYNHDLFEVNFKEVQAGRTYLVKLKLFLDKIKPGRLFEKITIHTNLKEDPVKVVNVWGYVRE